MPNTILIIEDSEPERMVLGCMIEKLYDYKIIEASSAEEARNTIKALDPSDIFAIMLDLNLPGIGGLDLLMEIKSASAEAKIIVTTGSSRHEDVIQALRLGACDYIIKPINISRLKSSLASLEKNFSNAEEMIALKNNQGQLKDFQTLEYEIYHKFLKIYDGNISKAAKSLGVTRSTFYKKVE